MVVNICGVEYSIEHNTPNNDEKLVEFDGYSDCTSKKIVIADFDDTNNLGVQNIAIHRENVLRHEIIHAFAYECGIERLSELPEEILVQWIAMQLPKINSIIECVKEVVV